MNGMNLSGKSRHGTADTDPADVWTAADSRHPSAFRDVAIHDRSPASELHDALRRAVYFGEIALLVVAGPIASFMHGLPNSHVGRN